MLAPLPLDQWDPGLDHVRDSLGSPLHVHRVLARHPALMRAWMPLRDHVVASPALPARLRELLILRLAWRGGITYEWVHHTRRGLQAGLAQADVDAVARDGIDPRWCGVDADVLAAADELVTDGRLSDRVLRALLAELGEEGLLDVLVTAGVYTTLGFVLQSLDVPLEPDA